MEVQTEQWVQRSTLAHSVEKAMLKSQQNNKVLGAETDTGLKCRKKTATNAEGLD